MVLDADLTPEELKIFLAETDEQIEMLDEDIVRLENEGDNIELLQEIFRAAHTLKGSSAMVGLERMAELTHAMESLLDKLRNGTLPVTTGVIDALLYGLDALKVLKEEITASEESDLDIGPVVAALREVAQEEAAAKKTAVAELTLGESTREGVQEALARGESVYQVDVSINEQSDWAAVRCLQILNDLARSGAIIASAPSAEQIDAEEVGFSMKLLFATSEDEDTVHGVVVSIPEVESAAVSVYHSEEDGQAQDKSRSAIDASRATNSQSFQSVRIDVKVLDNLMNIVEELVIDRSRISRVGKMLQEKYPDDDLIQQLRQTSNHIIQVINELQEDIMRVRMVPIGTIFSRFPRLVRDLAQTQQKQLEFVIEGEDTELDRSIIEQIRDPLIHILRNAVDHGIEPPEARIAAGKPEKATIRLAAYHEQGHIVIAVTDDGGGIDSNVVRESAVRKGLISPEAAEQLSATEAINLIFDAGMSTAEKATEVSGRGVGLDIVRSNVESLNGSISLSTRVGQGSTFTIRLPLTVAIVQGLLISAGGVAYVMPLASLVETLMVEPGQIHTIGGREMVRLRDSIVPLLRLDRILGGAPPETDSEEKCLIVVVRAGDDQLGIVVDALMERQEVVVKSLGDYLGDITGIAGATILGDGQVALILEVGSLAAMAAKRGARAGFSPATAS